MYKISVPIRGCTVTKKTRNAYLDLLRRSKAERVFLTRTALCANEAEEQAMIESFRENIEFFTQNGIEAAIWVGTTIGHGTPLVGITERDSDQITPLQNLAGECIPNTRCPLDPVFREQIGHHLACLAQTGTKLILLDDDFRMSQHGPEFCCTCPRHMARMQELTGEAFTREELRHLVFEQKANKYRHAWLTAQSESLRLLAQSLREAVDAVDPSIRLALCTAGAVWDIDGISPLELATILAGNNPPLIRLYGAPYTALHPAHNYKGLPAVFESARQFGAITRHWGIERMAEGDVYPRPRSYIPASYLELYDALIRADGTHDGILKYMADYISSPDYERGYFDHHMENLPLMEQVSELFDGMNSCGVRTPNRPALLKQADLELGLPSYISPVPSAGILLGSNSIPTTYTEGGICNAIFGEEARYSTEDELKKGALLDAISAVILTERGVDVGLSSHSGFESGAVSYMMTADESERSTIIGGDCRILKPVLKEGTEPVLLADFNGHERIFAYRYENKQGQRFLVYLYDSLSLPRCPNLLRCYLHQSVLKEHIEWIAGEKLPAFAPKHPDLYIFCKEKDGRMAVGLFNCYADKILHPVIELNKPYRSIRFLNCNGKLEGNTVTLDAPLPAFDFAFFEVE